MITLKAIVCDNCHKEAEDLPFELNWKYKSEECKHCRHTEESYRRFEFCSSKCLRLWAQRFDGHKHQWEINQLTSGALTRQGQVLSVVAYCTICKEEDWCNKDKKLLEKYRKSHKAYLKLSKKLNENVNTRTDKKSVHKPKK